MKIGETTPRSECEGPSNASGTSNRIQRLVLVELMLVLAGSALVVLSPPISFSGRRLQRPCRVASPLGAAISHRWPAVPDSGAQCPDCPFTRLSDEHDGGVWHCNEFLFATRKCDKRQGLSRYECGLRR